MQQLRTHLPDAETFLKDVHRLQDGGYHLAALRDHGQVVAVAGYRFMETLHAGRFLYVDDLVTDGTERSKGHGKAMLDWLRQQARDAGCDQLALDSGLQRLDAHRFYRREGMQECSFNFRQDL